MQNGLWMTLPRSQTSIKVAHEVAQAVWPSGKVANVVWLPGDVGDPQNDNNDLPQLLPMKPHTTHCITSPEQ